MQRVEKGPEGRSDDEYFISFQISLRICLFLHFGLTGKSDVNTVLIKKSRGFGSRLATSTDEIHFDKLKIRILIQLFGNNEPGRHTKTLNDDGDRETRKATKITKRRQKEDKKKTKSAMKDQDPPISTPIRTKIDTKISE